MISEYLSPRTRSRNNVQLNDGDTLTKGSMFPILVLSSQLLLLALAIAWFVHMILIAMHGKIFFAEPNSLILYGEITATALIALFAVIVFILQWKRSWGSLDKQ